MKTVIATFKINIKKFILLIAFGLFSIPENYTAAINVYNKNNNLNSILSEIKEKTTFIYFQNPFEIKTVPAGSGTSSDPYQITTLNDLNWLSQNNNVWDKYFVQTADIDASATSTWDGNKGWSPVGNNSCPFTGSYDGQGHIITNLYIHRSGTNHIGFFGKVSTNARIKNLGLKDVDIKGGGYCGGLAGYVMGNWGETAEISCCFVTGSIEGGTNTGGFVGYMTAFSKVENSYSICSLKGSWGTGGFAGSVWDQNYTRIINCYAASVISGGSSSGKGGVVGQGHNGTVVNTFWNTDLVSSSPLGIGINTIQMQTQSTFTNAGWDFSNIWCIVPSVNNGYPILQWQQPQIAKKCTWTGNIDNQWSNPGNWDINTVPSLIDSVIIPHFHYYNHELIIDEPVSNPAKCHYFNINLGAKVTVNATMALTVNNNFVNNGYITVKSSNTGDACFIVKGTRSGNGTEIVERYLSSNQWHLVSSPLSNGITNTFYGLWLKPYNEAINDFGNYITLGTIPIPVGQGFAVWADNNTTITFKGNINANITPTINLNLTGSPSSTSGWNLIGNPFPSSIDWNSSTGWVKHNVGNTIYVWNGSQYATWNGTTGTNGGSQYIAMGQGFFVQATATGANIQLNSEAQVAQQVTFKNNKANQLIRLTVNGNDYSDEHVICLNYNTTNVFDYQNDAVKLFGIEEAPQLFSFKDNVKTAIHNINKIEDINNIDIYLKAPLGYEYTLSFSNDITDNSIIILDKETGTIIYPDTPYTFTITSDESSARFMIVNSSAANNLNDKFNNSNEKTVTAFYFDKQLIVKVPENDNLLSVEIYSTTAALIYYSKNEINNLSQLKKGVYFAKINLKNQQQFIKFIVSD